MGNTTAAQLLQALHTAARRYCLERLGALVWLESHTTRNYESSRSGILRTILNDIESTIPDGFNTPDDLQAYLLLAGQTAQNGYALPPDQARQHAIDAERSRFCDYVRSLDNTRLRTIVPLPFERHLDDATTCVIWNGVCRRWNVRDKDRAWHPLDEVDLPPHVVALQKDWFDFAVPIDLVHAILRAHGRRRVWELPDFGRAYEVDVEVMDLYSYRLDGAGETYYADRHMDWLIYVSHESSVTVAGEWLLDAVKAEWPTWERHIWDGWDYERPAAD